MLFAFSRFTFSRIRVFLKADQMHLHNLNSFECEKKFTTLY